MRWLAVVVLVALAAPAIAARHRILVLPVEGTADAAIRGKLTGQLARLARSLDGQVATGSATFADTALAVGCDPHAPGCSDEVMATLGVDELVWATATRDGGRIRLVVRRVTRGGAAREVSTVFATGEADDRITAGIAPVFGAPGTEPVRPPVPDPASPSAAPNPTVAAEAAAGAPATPTGTGAPADLPGSPDEPGHGRDRTLGFALAGGGALSLALGLALWASYASLQDQIDNHAVRTPADFQDLRSLEDSASNRAIGGDIFVVAGLVAGGLGAYYLIRDHRRHGVVVAPAAVPGGAGMTITWTGGR
jgi:hypothetical protein